MKRVLVVDDEAPVARLVATALKSVEIEHMLDHCSDGAQGRMKAAQGGYDLIVLDLAMPFMDGTAALEEMRRNPKSRAIPVVVLTGVLEREVHNRVAELGVAALVTKPCDVKQLGTVLRSALAAGPSLTGGKGSALRPMGTA